MKMIYGCIKSEDEDLSEDEDDDAHGVHRSKDLELSMVNVCKRFNLPSDKRIIREQWISALVAQRPEACFAIVVLLLPNLKSLNMTTCTDCDDQNVIFVSQAMNLITQLLDVVLPNLEILSFGGDEWCIHIEQISHFIYLPTLREVTLYGLSMEEFAWTGPLTSHIEALDIEEAASLMKYGLFFCSPCNN
jgi:hypothetical protein